MLNVAWISFWMIAPLDALIQTSFSKDWDNDSKSCPIAENQPHST